MESNIKQDHLSQATSMAYFERNFKVASIGTDTTMPWCPFDTDISLPGAQIKIRNVSFGTVSVDFIREPPRPVIESIFPAAVCSGEVTLVVSGLAADAGLEVLCCFKGKYRDLLDVTRVELRPDGKASVGIIIPPCMHMRPENNLEFSIFGAAWLEVVQSDTAKGMRSSLPRPILVTHSEDIMQEVAPLHKLLPEEMTASDVDALIQELAAVMHSDENDVPPPLRCFASVVAVAAQLGLTQTMSAAVCSSSMYNRTAAEVLEAADCGSPGSLLRQAVLSGKVETVEELVELYRSQMLPVPLNEPNPESGMTALHWAALVNRDAEMLRFFSCRCPDEFAAGFNGISPAHPGEVSPRTMLLNNRRPSSKMAEPETRHPAAAATSTAVGMIVRACEGLNLKLAPAILATVSTVAFICGLMISCAMSSVLISVFWAKALLMAATVLNAAWVSKAVLHGTRRHSAVYISRPDQRPSCRARLQGLSPLF